MTERNVRPVPDDERLAMVMVHIIKASEIIEAFRVAFEDGIEIVPESAVREAQEALDHLNTAFVGVEGSQTVEVNSTGF